MALCQSPHPDDPTILCSLDLDKDGPRGHEEHFVLGKTFLDDPITWPHLGWVEPPPKVGKASIKRMGAEARAELAAKEPKPEKANVVRSSSYKPPRPAAEKILGPSHHDDPETSPAAAEGNFPRSGTQRQAILQALAEAGDRGATDYELWQATYDGPNRCARPHVAGTRRKTLVDDGYAEQTDERRPTDTGNLAVVWRITEEGLVAARTN